MPRHPPNTLETLDRSHLQRPTPDAPSLDGLTGRGPERRTSSAFCYPVSTTERSWGPDRSRGHDECHGTSPDRSEEHTSELQSLMRISSAVFCLKKKKRK